MSGRLRFADAALARDPDLVLAAAARSGRAFAFAAEDVGFWSAAGVVGGGGVEGGALKGGGYNTHTHIHTHFF